MVELLEVRARRFRAMGDPTRLAILALLEGGPRCVCKIQPEIGVAANLLSHHLKILREAGLICAEKTGRWVEYRLEPTALLQLHASIPAPSTSDPSFQSIPNYVSGAPQSVVPS